MIIQTILSLLLLLASTATPPSNYSNPMVQVMLSQTITTFNARTVMTFPKAYTTMPSIASSFINFQANTISVGYNLKILPGTGVQSTSLTLTNYDFEVRTTVTVYWVQAKLSFLMINSSISQFAILQTFQQTSVNTTLGATNQKDIFIKPLNPLPSPVFNLTNQYFIAAFTNGFDIRPTATMLDWYRPGFILDYGIYNQTYIWYSIQAIQNTIIVYIKVSFLIVDTNISKSTINRFQNQNVFISNVGTSIPATPISPYNQYNVMAGINSFRFNYTVLPQFELAYPTFLLTTTLTLNYSINVTVVNMYVVQCTAPDIHYKINDNLCYQTCPDHFYSDPPYCKQCHYTCKNCTAFAACATCLDLTQSTKTLAGDFCNCNLGYFADGFGTCSKCNLTCVSCSVNQNNCTSCYSGFQVKQPHCIEICGDGILFNSACDDGNINSGDGCSSTCAVENNYTCINGTTTTPSVCSYNQPFQLRYISSSQGNSSNTVYIQLSITPNISHLATLNLSQYITFNLPFIKVSHSYFNSSLNLTIDFTQPVNNTYNEIVVTLTPPTTSSYNFKWKPSSVVAPYGTQVVLTYQIAYSLSGIIKIILIVIQSLSFLCLFVVYRKMVVLQFIIVLQIVALSTSYIPQNYSFILTFNYLHQIGINGYNNIFSYYQSPIPTQLSFQRLQYHPQLFMNYNFMFIINICIFLIYFILYFIQSKVQEPHSDRLEMVNSYIQNQILPTFIIFSLTNLSFSIGQTVYVYSSVDSDIFNSSFLASNLSIMFASLFLLTLLCEYYRTNKTVLISIRRQFHNTRGYQLQFIIWIIYKFSIGFIMGVAHNYLNSLIALSLLVFGYILYCLITRSIRTSLLLAKHLSSQVILLYLFIILTLYRYNMIDQLTINGLIPGFLLIGLLVIGLIFVLIYTGYSIYQSVKIFTKKTPISKIQYFNNKEQMNEHYEEVNRLRQENKNRFKRRIKRRRSQNLTQNSLQIV